MKRRPQEGSKNATTPLSNAPLLIPKGDTGLVLSGGGARAAYQVGALRALVPYLEHESLPHQISIIVGSSIGAINGLLLGCCLKGGLSNAVEQVEEMWRIRNFRNTFSGTPSQAFFRAVKMAVLQYMAPGPHATSSAIFDPTPLMTEVDGVMERNGGLLPENRYPYLKSIGVMTTVESTERKPLLFLSCKEEIPKENLEGATFEVCKMKNLTAKHGFASAALPSVLPPVELDIEGGSLRLVDGGISQNIPVDPAVRLGADRVIVIDISGRDWWLRKYNEEQDTRPTWEVPAALKTFCLRPPEIFVVRCQTGLGTVLKESVAGSRRKFMAALGPVWPVFQLLKAKLGEEVAFEAMTYVALDEDYIHALMLQGYNETLSLLRKRGEIEFTRKESYAELLKEFQG